MEDPGQQLTGYLVHVGDHEQKALGGGKGGGQGSCGQASVHGPGGTGLGLQLPDGYLLPEDVLVAFGGPFVGNLAHVGGGGNGIDGCSIAQGIGDVGCSCVSVNSFHFFRHKVTPGREYLTDW